MCVRIGPAAPAGTKHQHISVGHWWVLTLWLKQSFYPQNDSKNVKCVLNFVSQDAFVKITRHEGLKSLWSGLPPTLWVLNACIKTVFKWSKASIHEFICLCVFRVMAVPATVIYFTCYDQLRDFLRYGLGFQGSHIPLVAGGLARCKCMRTQKHFPAILCSFLTSNICMCVFCSRGCDSDQPSGAGEDKDAVVSAVLQRAGGVYPLCCGAGRPAVTVEGLGTHRSQRRSLFWWGEDNTSPVDLKCGCNINCSFGRILTGFWGWKSTSLLL